MNVGNLTGEPGIDSLNSNALEKLTLRGSLYQTILEKYLYTFYEKSQEEFIIKAMDGRIQDEIRTKLMVETFDEKSSRYIKKT